MSATDAELRRVGKAVRELVEALLELPASEREQAWLYQRSIIGICLESAETGAEGFSVRVPEPPQLRVVK